MRFTDPGSSDHRLALKSFPGFGLSMVLVLAAALSAPAHAADSGPAVTPTLVVAALPSALDLAPTAATPITPIQQQTCGCTPQGKQKIIVIISGKEVCTATTLPCTAP